MGSVWEQCPDGSWMVREAGPWRTVWAWLDRHAQVHRRYKLCTRRYEVLGYVTKGDEDGWLTFTHGH